MVVGEGDALVFGLSGLLSSGILSLVLLLRLGNGLTGLLVLKLGIAFGGTPRLSSLLVGTTVTIGVNIRYKKERVNKDDSYVVAPDLWVCLSSRSRGKRPPRPISALAHVFSKLQRLLLKERVVEWDLLTSTDASTLTTTRTISRGLLGGTALVAFPASGAITESYTAAISTSETCMSQTDCCHGIVF